MSKKASGSQRKRHYAAEIVISLASDNPHELQGKIIKLLRQSKGWSQSEFAQKLGISRGSVSDIEKRGASDGVQLFAIAQALEVDVKILGYSITP